MKKLIVLSLMTTSLLLVGCSDSKTTTEVKAEHSEKSAMKCGEGKCGGAETKTEGKCGSAVEEVKEKASHAVESAKKAVAQKAEAVAEKAAAATESAKEAASSAMDKVKSAAATATAAVTEAVTTGPDGKALYAKCQGCHGADGKTKAMGKASPLAGQSKADIVSKITAYKAGKRNEAGMGALMKGQVASFSDADVDAIATYISGL